MGITSFGTTVDVVFWDPRNPHILTEMAWPDYQKKEHFLFFPASNLGGAMGRLSQAGFYLRAVEMVPCGLFGQSSSPKYIFDKTVTLVQSGEEQTRKEPTVSTTLRREIELYLRWDDYTS